MNSHAQENARPASVDDLKLLLRALNEHGVDCIDFDGVSVRTLNLEGLLKTKQTSRDKDKLDRVVLERA